MKIAIYSDAPDKLKDKITSILNNDALTWKRKTIDNQIYYYHMGTDLQWEDVLLSFEVNRKTNTLLVLTRLDSQKTKEKESFVIGRFVSKMLANLHDEFEKIEIITNQIKQEQ